MKNITIEDCKENVLQGQVWKASIDYSLFHFTPERHIIDKNLFADCSFFNLFINHKVEWELLYPVPFKSFFRIS